jgi:hypothetical protein
VNEDRTEIIRKRVASYYKDRSDLVTHITVYAVVNPVLWGFWAFALGMDSFPWMGLMSLAWGLGVAAHWLEVRAKAPARFAALEQRAQAQMARVYGPDWDTVADERDYARVLKTVEKAAQERRGFMVHLAAYIFISLLLWFIWAGAQSITDFPFPLLVMAGWGMGLAAHGITVFFGSARQQLAREEAMEREVERWAGQEARVAKKKKRDSSARLELTDDGELIEIVDESWDTDARRSRES